MERDELYGFRACRVCGRRCDGDVCDEICARRAREDAEWQGAHPCAIARDLPPFPSIAYAAEQHPCRCALGEDGCQGCESCRERAEEEAAEAAAQS
jgi:hypothetical protein